MKIINLFLFFAMILLAKNSSAYIDPGTGGMIIGSIWPVIVAFFAAIGGFFVKVFWKPIKNFFSKIKK